jgi:hypothetical protein
MENDDWGYLAEYLREDGDVTPALRAYLTDVLNKKKRARRRPPSVAKQTKDLFLAMMVVASERMGATPREAIKIATDLGGADRSTVQRAVKECRGIIEQGIEEARDGDDILI